MKYFIKFRKARRCGCTVSYEDSYMFMTCDDVEKAWYEYNQELRDKSKLIDITPLSSL